MITFNYIYRINVCTTNGTKISKSLSSKFPIYLNCTKIRINELERKVKDYKNYPEKYSKCPEDIKDLVSIDEDESEEIE